MQNGRLAHIEGFNMRFPGPIRILTAILLLSIGTVSAQTGAKSGIYLEVRTCQTCAFPGWQDQAVTLLRKAGYTAQLADMGASVQNAAVGDMCLVLWDLRPLKKATGSMTAVWIGPFPAGEEEKPIILSFLQNAPSTLRPLGRSTNQAWTLTTMNCGTYDPGKKAFGLGEFEMRPFQVLGRQPGQPAPPPSVSVVDVIANPRLYNEKLVSVSGTFVEAGRFNYDDNLIIGEGNATLRVIFGTVSPTTKKKVYLTKTGTKMVVTGKFISDLVGERVIAEQIE